jgi:hypothetical protein
MSSSSHTRATRMAFPSYSDIWQNFQSGHFGVAAQAAIAKAELSQEQSYHYVTDAFAYYDPAIFRDTSLFIIQLVIIFILVVGIILLAVLKRRR